MNAARHFRVDPRLVHATVVNVWVPTTGARTLIIADQKVAEDSRRREILEMSAMGSVSVRFIGEADARQELARCSPDQTVLMLFSTLEAVEAALAAGLTVPRLCIGHVPEGAGRTPLHPAVHLGPSDLDTIERIQKRGTEVVIQPLPQDKAVVVPRRTHDEVEQKPPVSRAQGRFSVVNTRGLHLRAAHVLAQLAATLPCEVQIGNDGAMVNAKSLLGLTTLGAACGSLLDVVVEGPDAPGALEKIRACFADGFSEGADHATVARRKGGM
jgi:phosphotransferase system HPr (HPr) family protein